MENPFLAARYHSLVIDKDSCPEDLEVTAQTADGTIMAVRHRRYPHVQVCDSDGVGRELYRGNSSMSWCVTYRVRGRW